VVGTSLNEAPKQFEYATVNYDILALVIEKSVVNFEDYMREKVLGS
jgi:CubicO group peptidase (beta-lactamase class C family)